MASFRLADDDLREYRRYGYQMPSGQWVASARVLPIREIVAGLLANRWVLDTPGETPS